jgi:tRNA(fMet)-specific endonuclease VapC
MPRCLERGDTTSATNRRRSARRRIQPTLRYILDTDVVSYAIRGHGRVAQKLLETAPSQVCMSTISYAELMFGCEKNGSKRLRELVSTFVSHVEVLAFDSAAAVAFGKIANTLAKSGIPIGHFDALIAGHAMSLDYTLVTNNIRHFARVPDLKLENWT